MNKALIERTLTAMERGYMHQEHAEYCSIMEALKAELEKPEPEPVAYLAWRDGKPCWDGDDCVCQDAVYPIDFDDDRTSMPVYLALRNNV